eukprot:CAMPEP_0179078130 /NCGR_PEP_ID=MMETSP0796-20121207/34967_1 /TAXON_ID=73915 /ORGANISM="Pyrodinium bahamense, Strain pbaha01" /LENGTH=131 /DNA_ID=CAMNT_0020775423 /DNA_START=412 /DNA_END=804 /DNA_ORIENTATION=-
MRQPLASTCMPSSDNASPSSTSSIPSTGFVACLRVSGKWWSNSPMRRQPLASTCMTWPSSAMASPWSSSNMPSTGLPADPCEGDALPESAAWSLRARLIISRNLCLRCPPLWYWRASRGGEGSPLLSGQLE